MNKIYKYFFYSFLLLIFLSITVLTFNSDLRRFFLHYALNSYKVYMIVSVQSDLKQDVPDLNSAKKKILGFIKTSKKVANGKSKLLIGIYDSTNLVQSRIINSQDFGKLEEVFRELVKMDPLLFKAKVWYAKSLIANQKNSEAITQLNDALKLNPLDVETYKILIKLASNENNLEDKLQTALYLSTNEDLNFVKEMVKSILCIAPEYGKKIAKKILNKSLKCGNIFMHLEEDPIRDNQIVLDPNNKDINQIPLVKIKYKSSLKSKKNTKSELEKLANLFKQKDLGRVALADEIYNLKEFQNLGNYHHMGGTRVGQTIKDSVINKDFKTHDVNNLYVLGSSNFRFGTYKNPTFTIIQYSVKLANDLIKKLV